MYMCMYLGHRRRGCGGCRRRQRTRSCPWDAGCAAVKDQAPIPTLPPQFRAYTSPAKPPYYKTTVPALPHMHPSAKSMIQSPLWWVT
jgi:hypothetical protein